MNNLTSSIIPGFFVISILLVIMVSSIPLVLAGNTDSSLTLTKPISHYMFEGNTFDSGILGNNGSVIGNEIYVEGKMGKSFNFNDTSSITLPNESDYDFERTSPFSISLWLKADSFSIVDCMISKKNENGTGWSLCAWDGNNKFTLSLVNTPEVNELRVRGELVLTDGLWHHIIVTYNGNSNKTGILMYDNGEPLKTSAEVNNLSASILNDQSVEIGSSHGTNLFTGQLDEVMIFNQDISGTLIPSPLKQHDAGIASKDTVCRGELQLIFKATNDLPACVNPNSIEKLVSRGWAKLEL